MLLAGVLLKLGAYGFLRLVIPLFPAQAQAFAPILGLLAVLGIILGAFAAWGQNDFKRLVAYSSVNHMGFVVLGVAEFAGPCYMLVTRNDFLCAPAVTRIVLPRVTSGRHAGALR